jgi:hypothetical protein
MASPTFDATKHDISIGGKGYMMAPEGRVIRQDAVAATARAALGEGRYDLYQVDAFFAQATFAGGAGQARLSASDAYLSGVCDGRWGGHLFPARKLIAAASTGGTTSFMFHRGSSVYGFNSSGNIELFGSNTAYTGLTTLPRNQPAVDGSNNMYYVTTDNKLGKFDGTNAVSDITSNLGADVTPYAVIPYHRYLWTLATQTVESTATIRQNRDASTSAQTVTVTYTNPPKPSSMLVLFLFTEDTTATVEILSDNWELRESITGSPRQIFCYTRPVDNAEAQTVRWRWDAATDASYILLEVDGIDTANPFVDAATSTTATTSITSGTVLPDSGINLFAIMTETSSGNPAPGADYTELIDATHSGSGSWRHVLHYRADTTDTSTTTTGLAAQAASGILLKLRSNAITADQTQFTLLYSEDEGNTWTMPLASTGVGVGTPTAAFAVGGFLWFTTERGLYQVGVEDEIFADGVTVLNIFVRGPVDTFNAPSNSANAGVWIAHFDGSLFYAVGQTLRSYPIGGIGGRQVWPTEDWGTTGGNIGAVVAGEGGVYFGAAETLYCFNGRGFHPLARNTTSGIYNALYFHQGRLYVNTDAASYYDFGYPSLRPDIYSTAATNFETGYIIFSMLDFEKVDVYKFISELQTLVEFTAASNSGTVTLDYICGCTGTSSHPERYGGGATSLTWTNIGSHTVADGGVKKYTPTPIKAKELFLRVTLTPGTSGYPILNSVVANGTALMPPVDRIVVPIMLGTDQRNKAGALMYANAGAVWDAKKELRDLRRGENTVAVKIIDDDGGTTAYTCIVEQLQDSIGRFKKINRAVQGDAQIVLRQVPGTAVTETRPT